MRNYLCLFVLFKLTLLDLSVQMVYYGDSLRRRKGHRIVLIPENCILPEVSDRIFFARRSCQQELVTCFISVQTTLLYNTYPFSP